VGAGLICSSPGSCSHCAAAEEVGGASHRVADWEELEESRLISRSLCVLGEGEAAPHAWLPVEKWRYLEAWQE